MRESSTWDDELFPLDEEYDPVFDSPEFELLTISLDPRELLESDASETDD
jgi:hypothetical protein